jgi:hypothetical protein
LGFALVALTTPLRTGNKAGNKARLDGVFIINQDAWVNACRAAALGAFLLCPQLVVGCFSPGPETFGTEPLRFIQEGTKEIIPEVLVLPCYSDAGSAKVKLYTGNPHGGIHLGEKDWGESRYLAKPFLYRSGQPLDFYQPRALQCCCCLGPIVGGFQSGTHIVCIFVFSSSGEGWFSPWETRDLPLRQLPLQQARDYFQSLAAALKEPNVPRAKLRFPDKDGTQDDVHLNVHFSPQDQALVQTWLSETIRHLPDPPDTAPLPAGR